MNLYSISNKARAGRWIVAPDVECAILIAKDIGHCIKTPTPANCSLIIEEQWSQDGSSKSLRALLDSGYVGPIHKVGMAFTFDQLIGKSPRPNITPEWRFSRKYELNEEVVRTLVPVAA